MQRFDFGITTQDRAGDVTGQRATVRQEGVGAVFIEPKLAGNGRGEGREPT